jgi:hypothetical protein
MPSSAPPVSWDPPIDPPPADVAEFIRFCHDRKPVGWPELYDEMCAVAARGDFNGWDHDQFTARGLTFSLFEMPRLSGWVRAVLAVPIEPIEGLAVPLIPG